MTQALAELLLAYGVWGVLSVSISGNIYLVRRLLKDLDDRQVREQQQLEKILGIFESKVETDVKHEMALQGITKAFDRLSDKLQGPH